MSVGTGHLATIGFGTSTTFVAAFTRIGGLSLSRPSIDTSDLSTSSWRSFIPGDLVDGGEMECEFNFAHKQVVPPITAVAETITITLPEATSAGNPPTIVFTGFVTGHTMPELMTDELMKATVTLKCSGQPVFTAETDA